MTKNNVFYIQGIQLPLFHVYILHIHQQKMIRTLQPKILWPTAEYFTIALSPQQTHLLGHLRVCFLLILNFILSSLFDFHFLIYQLHHLQKLFLGKYPFLHKQPSEGFLLDYLRHEEFFKRYDLFIFSFNCHVLLLMVLLFWYPR